MLNSEEYLLGRTSEEYQRLERQAMLWQPLALRMIKETGLKEGMKCLDVGCGTGNVMRLMGSIVGKGGSVSGIDIDEKVGNEALNILNNIGDSVYYFESKDVMIPGAIEPGTYDFIYTRFVLIHQTDPVSMVRKLYDALKPGGTLLVQDYDMASIKVNEKTIGVVDYFRDLLIKIFTQTGKDPEAGMHLSIYFEEAGIGSPDGTDASSIITKALLFMQMIKAVALSMKPGITGLNLSTPDRFEQFIRDTEQKGIELGNYYYTWPMVNSAWKHKKQN